MNRRTVIRNVLVFSAGAALFPSCLHEEGKASIALKNIPVNGDEEKLLAALAETIIPSTDTPGAKDLSAHLFVLKMVDDCYKKEDQQKFMNGLKAFEKRVSQKSGKLFADCDESQRNEIVAALDGEKPGTDDLLFFYNAVKRLTVQAYTTSQFYMTKIANYKMIPGRFQGCVPVKSV